MRIYEENRVWGGFRRFTLNKTSTVKIITIKPRKRFSLQYHKHRAEFWEFLDNDAKVTIGNKTFGATKGKICFIPKKTLHRIEAYGKPVRVLEISFGKFNERDIVRVADDYGRA